MRITSGRLLQIKACWKRSWAFCASLWVFPRSSEARRAGAFMQCQGLPKKWPGVRPIVPFGGRGTPRSSQIHHAGNKPGTCIFGMIPRFRPDCFSGSPRFDLEMSCTGYAGPEKGRKQFRGWLPLQRTGASCASDVQTFRACRGNSRIKKCYLAGFAAMCSSEASTHAPLARTGCVLTLPQLSRERHLSFV